MDVAGRSFVTGQPAGEEEQVALWRAAAACPTRSIGNRDRLCEPAGVFPHQMTDGVFALDNNALSSFAAHSFLATRPEGNLMIDSPGFSRALAEGVDALPRIHRTEWGGRWNRTPQGWRGDRPGGYGTGGANIGLLLVRGSRSCGGRRQQGTLAGRFVRRELERSSTDWWMRARMVDRLPAPRSGGKRQGAQSGQGASELGLPRPAPRQVQGQAAG